MLIDSAARPVEACWWVRLPLPSKASAVSSSSDETAGPKVISSFDLKKNFTSLPVLDEETCTSDLMSSLHFDLMN